MTKQPHIASPADIAPIHVELYGGKAVNLAELGRIGVEVPPWFVLSAAAFDAMSERAGLADLLAKFDAKTDLAKLSAKLQKRVLAEPVPADLLKAIQVAFDGLFGSNAMAAVRSSARDEDGSALSMAGLHDSLLFVGTNGLDDAIRRVWASAFTERALQYRLTNDLATDQIGIAVVVQQMIDAEVSGVAFSANPISEDVEEMMINAVWGAGEGLVSQGLPADSFLVHKLKDTRHSEVANKPTKFVFDRDAGTGLIEVPVPEKLQDTPTLNSPQLEHLAEVIQRVEDHYRRPQDIEFCFAPDGQLHIVQTRPITTMVGRGPSAGHRLVWDNSNIIESYSGVTTPMTFSFIRRAYTIVYQCFSEVMGVSDEEVRENMPVFENMLGLIRGEVYYNLLNWYRLIQLFPGYELNKNFMESMMGVDESLTDDPTSAAPVTLLNRAMDIKSLLQLAMRSGWNFTRIERVAGDFEAHFERHFSEWATLDFDQMPPHELMHLYRKMEDKLLWNWKAPIINDFFVMIFYGLLEKCCKEWCGDEDGTLQNDLICGEGGIATKEASNALIRLAQIAADDPALAEVIREGVYLDASEGRGAEFPRFQRALEDYLEEYGYRSMNELKLEEPTLREQPEFIFQMLRNYLNADDTSVLDLEGRRDRELAIRHRAEARAFGSLSLPKQLIFRRVLKNARLGVKNRENMRFARTKIYGLVRELLLSVGASFARDGVLKDRDDIFYLSVDEVWDFIKGTAVTTDLSALVALRRAEFDGYRAQPERSPSDRFVTYGSVYDANAFRRPRRPKTDAPEGVMVGTGCCSGVVEGPVRIIRSPGDDMQLNGEILVAERTDPGWVPLYPSVSGVLIERGSVLSHSAIVAREMGLPAIVGIEGLLDSLQDGQIVRMDGAAGTVEIVE